MESTTVRRPGGRTAQTTAKVNAAVMALLAESGVESCTIPVVAARAGVQRSTLYRRYPDRWAMMVDAIAHEAETQLTSSDRGSLIEDLSALLRNLARLLESPLGPAVMSVAVAIQSGSARHYADRFWAARARQLRPMFDAAVERGELSPDVELDEVFAIAAGPIYYRVFISPYAVDDRFIEAVTASVRDHFIVRPT